MKTILQLFLIGVVILSLTNCSDDDFMDIKGDLLGTWVNENNEADQLTFYEDNRVLGTLWYNNNEYSYGFISLDTIAFFKEISGTQGGYAFDIHYRGEKLTIKRFKGGDAGVQLYDYTYYRMD